MYRAKDNEILAAITDFIPNSKNLGIINDFKRKIGMPTGIPKMENKGKPDIKIKKGR